MANKMIDSGVLVGVLPWHCGLDMDYMNCPDLKELFVIPGMEAQKVSLSQNIADGPTVLSTQT